MVQRVHIMGASGCGVSTLGRAVAQTRGWPYYDTDDFYWQPTDPPFRFKRPEEERLERLMDVILTSERWVLGGALDGWGDPLIGRFDLIVFLEAPTEERLRRLRARERKLFGDRIAPGGDMHDHHRRFLEYAENYEGGAITGGRCRARHEAWLEQLSQPVLRLDATRPRDDLLRAVLGSA